MTTDDNKEKAKGATVPGQGTEPGKGGQTPPPTTPPEPGKGVKPPTGKVEGDETWEQRAKTNEGLLKQANTELATLKQTHLDFSKVVQSVEGLSNIVAQQAETLTLHTDILSDTVGQSEELQTRVAETKKRQQAVADEVKTAQGAFTEIASQLSIIGLDPNSQDAGLLPISKAFNAKDYTEAKKLTNALVKERVATLQKPSEEGEEGKGGKKGPPAVITSTPGATTDWQNLSRQEKVQIGLEERRRQQQ